MSEEWKKTARALVLPADASIIDAYCKGLDDQQEKDISEFVNDLDEIVDWCKYLPADSEINIRLGRKVEKREKMLK